MNFENFVNSNFKNVRADVRGMTDDSVPIIFARRKRSQAGAAVVGQGGGSGPSAQSAPEDRCFVCQDGCFAGDRRDVAAAATKRIRESSEEVETGVASVEPRCRESLQATTSAAQRKKVLTQLHLDFGQRNFHSTQCSICGFVYTPGKREEERLHDVHHEQAVGLQVIKFRTMAPPGSTLVAKDGTVGGRIYVLRGLSHTSDGQDHKTIVEVGGMLERELGMCQGWATAGVRDKGVAMYIYMNASKELVGCVVVELDPVRAEVAVVVDSEGKVEKPADYDGRDGGGGGAGDKRNESGAFGDGHEKGEDGVYLRGCIKRKKQCAVRVMWASKSHRRERVVTALLDCVRGQLVPGQIIARHDVAYSQPTRDGALFIAAYSGQPRGAAALSQFWVYE